MSVIACTQFDVLGDECPECGGPLNRVQRGGFPAQAGYVCDEDCATDMSDRIARQRVATHLHQRDLMCECETCTAAGHPTVAERAEWAAYLAGGKP